MDDNKNIEEFFNNSLEGFNESPSDQVWEGISDRLISPAPLWKKVIWPLITATLLLIIGGIALNSLSLSQELNQSKQDFATQSILISNQNEEIRGFEKDKVELQSEVARLKTEINTILTNNESSNRVQQIDKGQISSTLLGSSSLYIPLERAPIFKANKTYYLQNFIVRNEISNSTSATEYVSNSRKTYWNLPSIQDLGLSNLINREERSIESITKDKSLKYNLPFLPFGNSNILSKNGPKFKYGFTFSLVGTKTDVTSTLDAGFNAGLALELQLYRKLWLTSGIRYNRNNYMMDFRGQNPIEESNFPTPRSLNDTYDRVDVQNSFIDFPFGLNLNLVVSKKNSLFINPGISWQFFLPQKYTYNTINNGQYDYSENRYFMYFGSAFLNAGFERKLSTNKSLQVSLWAEKGMSQFGIENRQIMNYGIKSTLYFSNR